MPCPPLDPVTSAGRRTFGWRRVRWSHASPTHVSARCRASGRVRSGESATRCRRFRPGVRRRAQLRRDRIQPCIRDVRDVLPKGGGQPGAFARLGIDEHHHAERTVAIKRMLGVRSHDDASVLAPLAVAAADGDASVERDDDLDGVVCMSGHDALSSSGEEEAPLPQVPPRDAQPPIRIIVRLV